MSARKSSAPEGTRDIKEAGRTESGFLRKKFYSGVRSSHQALGTSTTAHKKVSSLPKKTCKHFLWWHGAVHTHTHIPTYTHPAHSTCGFRRLRRSTLPAILWVSLVGVPLRRWVGSSHRSWRVGLRPHWWLWIRWVWGCRTGARIRWRVPLVH